MIKGTIASGRIQKGHIHKVKNTWRQKLGLT